MLIKNNLKMFYPFALVRMENHFKKKRLMKLVKFTFKVTQILELDQCCPNFFSRHPKPTFFVRGTNKKKAIFNGKNIIKTSRDTPVCRSTPFAWHWIRQWGYSCWTWKLNLAAKVEKFHKEDYELIWILFIVFRFSFYTTKFWGANRLGGEIVQYVSDQLSCWYFKKRFNFNIDSTPQ